MQDPRHLPIPLIGIPTRLLRWLSQYGLTALRPVSHVQAHLLVPYVVAGAREVLDGGELTGRSRWAIEDAIARLRDQRDVIDRGGHLDETSALGALMPSSGGSTVQFAELVLQSNGADQLEPAATLEEQERRSSQRLGEVIDALESLAKRDTEAARRIDDVFRAIITRGAQRKALADIF